MPKRAAHKELLKVLDNLDAIVYVADMETYELLYVNRFVKDAFGDITGKLCWKSLQTNQKSPCEYCTNKQILDSEGNPFDEPYRWEFQNTVNGHWYDIRDRAIEWVDGRIVRLEIAADITYKKRKGKELEQDQKLFELISSTQLNFIKEKSAKDVFGKLLNDFLELMESEYGFIGEVVFTDEGNPYLKTHSITNIAWNDDTRKFYADNEEKGFEFFNLDTLFGEVMKSKAAVVANDPYHDPRRGGLPEGHPALNSFLGLPFLLDGQMVGMVGIANKPGGYTEELVKYLAPFATVCANIIESYRLDMKRKVTEKRLIKRESQLRESQEIAKIGSWSTDLSTNKLEWSEETFRLFDQDSETFVPTPEYFLSKVHPDDKAAVEKAIQDAVENDAQYHIQPRIINETGREWVCEGFGKLDKDKAGKPLRLAGTAQDITERKKAEELLLERSKFIESLVNLTPDILYIYDIIEQRNVYSNDGIQKVLEYSKDEVQHMGDNILPDLMHPDDMQSYIENILPKYSEAKDGEIIYHQFRMKNKEGQWRWLEVAESIYARDANSFPKHIFGVAHDITVIKQTENELRDTLTEKEFLLKEVNHRVKNNLAILQSLVRMQTTTVKDSTAKGYLENVGNRIRTLSLIHERLYKTDDVTRIDMHDYVSSLASQIYRSLVIDESAIQLEVDVEEIILNVNYVIPCGLIINELLTNALKYAFPMNRTGTVIVSFRKEPNKGYRLSLKDNGSGMPKGMDIESKGGLGMIIAQSLAKQINGTFDYKVDNGTEFTIIFTDDSDKSV